MPQKFLSIKNFEKYQTYKLTNPPWFKVHKSFFGDREVSKLSPVSRFLYLGLIYLATETNNSIANDKTWIAQRLAISEPEVDLRPLYKAGFLKCTHVHRYLSGQDSSEAVQRQREGADAPTTTALIKAEARQKKPMTELPDGFTFNERHKSIADGFGLNVFAECARFKDKALAKGWTYKDWDAAFRNWLSTTAEFKRERQA